MQRLATLFCALLASCGTILNGGPFMVPVSSYPAGATVYYRKAPVGLTPCTVAMYPTDAALELTLAGYWPASVEAERSPNWIGAIGNGLCLLPGLLIGLPVDLATGCYQVVDTQPLSVSLRSSAPRPTAVAEAAAAPRQPLMPLVIGDSLFLSARSKLHAQLVTVEQIDGKVVTVRAVDSGETDAIEVPFLPEIDAARHVLDAKAKIRLNCYYR